MSNKNPIFNKWTVVVVMGIVIIGFLVHKPSVNNPPPQVLVPAAASTPTPAVTVEAVAVPEPAAAGVNQVASTVQGDQQVVSPTPVVRQAFQPHVNAPSPEIPNDKAQPTESTSADVANSMPSQEDALAAIIFENKKRQEANKMVTDRAAKIEEVHNAIIASGKLNESNQGKVYPAPLLDAPSEIMDKVKAHEVTVH